MGIHLFHIWRGRERGRRGRERRRGKLIEGGTEIKRRNGRDGERERERVRERERK